MAITSITSVIFHVSGVSSRVSTSLCPTTAVPRTASPHLSAILANAWAATNMCRDPLMARVLSEAMVHLSVHRRSLPPMAVTLARRRRVAGWFTHFLFPERRVPFLIRTLLPLRFPLLLLAYQRCIHCALIVVRMHAGACRIMCVCVCKLTVYPQQRHVHHGRT
eukprot:1189823-Prorocentrum_minimum.AAC.2